MGKSGKKSGRRSCIESGGGSRGEGGRNVEKRGESGRRRRVQEEKSVKK